MGVRAGVLGLGLAVVSGVLSLMAGGCGDRPVTVEPSGPASTAPEPAAPVGNEVPSPPPAASLPVPPAETGTPPPLPSPGGTPGPTGPGAGPWPTDAVADYTRAFGVGQPQSVGLDEGLNLWLLEGDRIGVLRPGDKAPTWVRGLGQAREPFGRESLAVGSTVICGGEAGRAYVGYRAAEMKRTEGLSQRTYIPGPGEPFYSPERFAEYQKGDLDAVRLQADGSLVLEEHIWRTTGSSNAGRQLGIHNTNDFHYEEDRSVFACARVTRGTHRGDLYITTNHGVTRLKGLTYNSHRHPGWYLVTQRPDGSRDESLQCPPMHALGLARNGDVLVANEQMLGVLVPSGKLEDWDRENTWEGPTPWRFKGFNEQLNAQAEDDLWRAFEQTVSERYYLGSAQFGVWGMTPRSRSAGQWTKLAGLPSERIAALKATDDGALYIGTEDAGLWRLEKDGVGLAPVREVAGQRVLQLVYEPTVSPSMLLVLTEQGLVVLRGP